jgi:hypothetical protein
MYVCVKACVCTYVCMCERMCMYVCLYVCIHMCMYVFACKCASKYTCKYMYAHMHAKAHAACWDKHVYFTYEAMCVRCATQRHEAFAFYTIKRSYICGAHGTHVPGVPSSSHTTRHSSPIVLDCTSTTCLATIMSIVASFGAASD